MKTREDSVNNFIRAIDELCDSSYLFASTQIMSIFKIVNSSKLLSDLFSYFTDDYKFYDSLISCFSNSNGVKSFIVPSDDRELIPLVYCLLQELSYNNFQLTDLLDYLNSDKDYELAYNEFLNKLIIPFKEKVTVIASQLITNTKYKYQQEEEKPLEVNIEQPKEEIVEKEDTQEKPNSTLSRVLRLMDLDRLAINQSRASNNEKCELLYVLSAFENAVKTGDTDKINLGYLAYYYALKPYIKIKTNLKEITTIIFNEEQFK